MEFERNFEKPCPYSYPKLENLLETKRKDQMGEIGE
jgi:hypothetical protein